MNMSRRKNRKDKKGVYNIDIQKYSIYPRIPKPDEYKPSGSELRPGGTLIVDIMDVDDKGRGIANYKGYRILVLGQATVGDRVKVRIERITGNTIIASILSMDKSRVEY